MKGVQGILLSIGLGLAGAVCNWMYLERLAGKEAKVSFIAIRTDLSKPVNAGDILLEEHLVRINIPRSAVGNLEQVAPRYEEMKLIVGFPTTRSFQGGELVLGQDIRTPATKDLNEKLGVNEVALWIPVDANTFNSSRVNPDDEISFILPRVGGAIAMPGGGEGGGTPTVASSSEIVGPFRILEIGNRTGRPEVQRQSAGRQDNSRSITIVAKMEKGHLDAKTERVTEYMRSTKSQGLQVIVHPKAK